VKAAPAADLLDDPQVRAAYLGGDIGGDPDAEEVDGATSPGGTQTG
jgi:branched-chain amino acid transport system ATP-binding protein